MGLGPNFGSTTAQKTIGNSNYNALESSFKYALGTRATLLLGYTYSKSIDDASNLGEEINPFNQALTRVISSWDMTHNFVATYSWKLGAGWTVSGTTRFSTGFPVTLSDTSDNSLLGTLGNGVNNNLLDTPQLSPGPLRNQHESAQRTAGIQYQFVFGGSAGAVGRRGAAVFPRSGDGEFRHGRWRRVPLDENRWLDLRVEAFNVFNHAQFYGPASVDGRVNDPTFGQVVSAAPPRLVQLAAKFHF